MTKTNSFIHHSSTMTNSNNIMGEINNSRTIIMTNNNYTIQATVQRIMTATFNTICNNISNSSSSSRLISSNNSINKVIYE